MFQAPTQVLESLQRVLAAHPYGASGAIATSPRADSDSTALWERLLSLSEAELEAVLAGLTRRQEGLLAYGAAARVGDPECLRVFGRLLGHRQPKSAGRAAWIAFVITDGAPAFREAARQYVSTAELPALWMQLANSNEPLKHAASSYFNSQLSFDRWSNRGEVGLRDTHLVSRKLRLHLLQPHTVQRVVEREGAEVLNSWLDEVFTDRDRVTWFQSYLSETYLGKWAVADPILRRIDKRFGPPEERRGFWSSVPDEVQRAFNNWLKNIELTRLMGEGERVAFWRRFLTSIEKSYPSRDRGAVFVCFQKWFAVQFVLSGHATYFFEKRHFFSMRGLDKHTLYRTVLERTSIGSYTHQGSNWSWRAESEVRRIMGMHS